MIGLADFIVVTDKPLLDKPALDFIHEALDGVPWFEATTFSQQRDYRTCSTFPMSSVVRGLVPVEWKLEGAKQRLERADQLLFGAIGAAGAYYRAKFPAFIYKTDTGYDILRYETGQFYKTHTDHHEGEPRSLAVSVALNNSFEGGAFSFFDKQGGITIKPGHAIMFPANFMFPHEIKPVTRGTRLSAITWFK